VGEGEFTAATPPAPRHRPDAFTDAPPDDFGEPEGPSGAVGLEGLSNNYSIRIGEWFRYAQAHWSAVLGPMIGYFLLFLVMDIGMSLIPCVGPILVIFLLLPCAAGFTIVPLAQLKGQPWTFGDFFGGFKQYWTILGNMFLVGLLTGAWILPGYILLLGAVLNHRDEKGPGAGPPLHPDDPLFLAGLALLLVGLVPSIYLSIRCGMFALPLIIDRKCGAAEAIRGNWRLTQGHFWGLLGVGLLVGLINLAGELACGVGVLFTLPYTQLALVAGYLLIAGTRPPVAAPVPRADY
jgi:hypothetical protein